MVPVDSVLIFFPERNSNIKRQTFSKTIKLKNISRFANRNISSAFDHSHLYFFKLPQGLHIYIPCWPFAR